MKRVVSVSLGSSRRDKTTELTLGDETLQLQRIGCEGNEQRARQLLTELDGQVDALGIGGVELYVRIAEKNYPLRSGLRLVEGVTQTPYTDGGGLKRTLERTIFQQVAAQIDDSALTPRKAMMPLACDRYGMAESLVQAQFEVIFCDLMFALGLPIPVRGLGRLRFLASLLLPIVGRLPISMLYPTGETQEKNIPKFERWFNHGPVIAGDFLYIRRHMPLDLSGKIIITNSTTEADVTLLRARGVAYLITSTPRLAGRSFGTNMLEAALIAYAGKGRLLSEAELQTLLTALDIQPQLLALNPKKV